MNDNYLWDRTGEPDPEIQKLEEVLGTLRYQPRPLEIPADIRIRGKRSFFPLAIAAAIALLAIGFALWVQISRSPSSRAPQANNNSIIAAPQIPTPKYEQSTQTAKAKEDNASVPTPRQPKTVLVAFKKRRDNRIQTREPELTPKELAEKGQVLLALRMVSAKLNLAQRKTVGAPPANNIRNQHKIG